MNQLKQDLKNHSFKPIYLFYGSEAYLKKLYKKKFTQAILPASDTMNLTYMEGKKPDIPTVLEAVNTMPFFSEKRLVILENTGFFTTSCALTDKLSSIPDTTVLLFIEDSIDKKTKMYKEVYKLGYVCEMNSMDDNNLKIFIASSLEKEGLKISEAAAQHMLMHCGTDMELLTQELNKLSAYCTGKNSVTAQDIDLICTKHLTRQIFQMMDYIGGKNQNKALALYHDLLSLREKPMSILALITRHFNKLLLIKDLTKKNSAKEVIAKKAGVPAFSIPKYRQQAQSFTLDTILDCLDYSLTQERKIKSGLINEQMAVELVILYCSR